MKTSNYDLNIWDELDYESGGEDSGGWRIDVYAIQSDYTEEDGWYFLGYGQSGVMLKDHTIFLTPSEAQELTLGWEKELGGYYTPDPDFWLDKETFLNVYKTIPERVKSLLWALPEYEVSGNRYPYGATTV